MKKLLGIIVLGLLLSSCQTGSNVVRWLDGERGPSYDQWKKKNSQYTYYVRVMSPSTGAGGYGSSNVSYDHAFQGAMSVCNASDCIIHTRGNQYVYRPPTREDRNIAKAQNVCRKLGVTPGTDRFTDCTIKMMSTSSGQQTVIVGQSQMRTVYPLHCRQMGGMSNC